MQGAKAALAEGMRAFESGESEFDLAGAATLDSAAVAILLAWRRAAQARGATLEFYNPPPALCSLAELYGVAELLKLSAHRH